MSHVEYETDGAVARVTLAKPPHNLIDAALTDGIVTAYDRAVAERKRCILLRSAMRHLLRSASLLLKSGRKRL